MNNTLFIILLNLFFYLKKDHFSKYLVKYRFFSPFLIIENYQYQRLLISYLYHLNLGHFLVNIFSFYNVSNVIERKFKKKYWTIILSSAILSNMIHILISLFALQFYNNYDIYYSNSLGLSKIIFAIRSIYYNRLNKNVLVYGFIIHTKYIIWIELLIMLVLTSKNSFIGDLSGITSGLIINNYI